MKFWSKPLILAGCGLAVVWLAGMALVDHAVAQQPILVVKSQIA